jgi:hypothetical protein
MSDGEHSYFFVVVDEEDYVREPAYEYLLVWLSLSPQRVPMRTLPKSRDDAIDFEYELFA